jgi:hypothetical protein
MPINPPVTQSEVSTSTWGIPVTNEVNRLTTLTAASLPLELAYAQITAQVPLTAGSPGAANMIISTAAVTYDGSPIIVEFYTPIGQTPAVAGSQIGVNLWDNSTDKGFMFTLNAIGAAAFYSPICAKRRITPSAGSHTYSVRGWVYPGGNTGYMMAGLGNIDQYAPAYLRITKAV